MSSGIDEERTIAERTEVVIGELKSGTITDIEAIKVLRAARLCATRSRSTLSSAGAVNGARHEITLASLDLIEALKRHGSRDQKVERVMTAVEAWKRELAAA
jgi:hypothetical protein